MGRNVAYNLAGKGYRVAVHDPWPEVVEAFDPRGPKGGPAVMAFKALSEFLDGLERPRSILMLVKAGEPTESAVHKLGAVLEPDDLLIDGGNSHYKDTVLRAREYGSRGLEYVGAGISGGEVGALDGPSVMLGGSEKGLERVLPMLEAAAAQVGGESCCAGFGPEGAGHFVKMVHNGIEYAEMQMIAETYALLGGVLDLQADSIAGLFENWNEGPLESYLVAITAAILKKADPETGRPLVEQVLDAAGQKGTGRWTAETALEFGTPVPALVEAVMARGLSALKAERRLAAKRLPHLPGEHGVDDEKFVGAIEKALLAARLLIFAQGFSLFRAGRETLGWPLPEARAAAVWRGGCIIRARQLDAMKIAFTADPDLVNLLLAPNSLEILLPGIPALRQIVTAACQIGIAVPVFGACLGYYDAYRSGYLPANLIQAQRDCFGAHGYERTDRSGTFHTDWSQ